MITEAELKTFVGLCKKFTCWAVINEAHTSDLTLRRIFKRESIPSSSENLIKAFLIRASDPTYIQQLETAHPKPRRMKSQLNDLIVKLEQEWATPKVETSDTSKLLMQDQVRVLQERVNVLERELEQAKELAAARLTIIGELRNTLSGIVNTLDQQKNL